jgi:flavodoxin
MPKSLIVYFSRADENWMANGLEVINQGNTEVLAEYIKERIDGDMLKLETTYEYPKSYQECCNVAAKEYKENARPPLKNKALDISKYDIIYIGYPIWWGTYPMIFKTFFETYDLSGKTIMPFSTNEGSGLGDSIKDLNIDLPNSIIKEAIAVRGSNVSNAKEKINKWIEEEI